MNKEVIWGVPTLRTKKVEKFNTPVVTMSSLAKKGAGRKFSFNTAAQEALGLEGGETYITFGFSGDSILVMASANEDPNGVQLTKQCSISNKRIYEYIAKIQNLNTDVENHLHLTAVEGQPYFEVSSIESESVLIESSQDNAEELETIMEEEVQEVPNSPGPVFVADSSDDEEDTQIDEEWA